VGGADRVCARQRASQREVRDQSVFWRELALWCTRSLPNAEIRICVYAYAFTHIPTVNMYPHSYIHTCTVRPHRNTLASFHIPHTLYNFHIVHTLTHTHTHAHIPSNAIGLTASLFTRRVVFLDVTVELLNLLGIILIVSTQREGVGLLTCVLHGMCQRIHSQQSGCMQRAKGRKGHRPQARRRRPPQFDFRQPACGHPCLRVLTWQSTPHCTTRVSLSHSQSPQSHDSFTFVFLFSMPAACSF